ncbi:hypothetical protein [Arthrobacter sp. CP30]
MSGSRRRTSNLRGPDVLVAINRAHILPSELWVYYYGIGGNLAELDIEAFLYNLTDVPTMDCLLLNHALFELLADQPNTR